MSARPSLEEPSMETFLEGNNPEKTVHLTICDQKFPQIVGLDRFRHVKNLHILRCEIKKIEGLGNLKKLVELHLDGNRIERLEGLNSLVELVELQICQNRIEKIENLENLKNLSVLEMSHNSIEMIEGLRDNLKLTRLVLNHNKIEKIEGLDKLNGLKTLLLKSNQIASFDGYALENLARLNLTSNKITKITGLSNLKRLKYLVLDYNRINKLEGMENLVSLVDLSISNNEISRIEGLENLENLEVVWLDGNKIKRIENLSELKLLKELHLASNEISEIEGLENVKNLRKLNLSNNNLTLIGGLSSLENLETLNLSSNKILCIDGLGRLVHLKELNIANNAITVIWGLDALGELELLDVSKNQIRTIEEGLECQKQLEVLNVGENPIEIFDGVDHLDNCVISLSNEKKFKMYVDIKKGTSLSFREISLAFAILGESLSGTWNYLPGVLQKVISTVSEIMWSEARYYEILKWIVHSKLHLCFSVIETNQTQFQFNLNKLLSVVNGFSRDHPEGFCKFFLPWMDLLDVKVLEILSTHKTFDLYKKYLRITSIITNECYCNLMTEFQIASHEISKLLSEMNECLKWVESDKGKSSEVNSQAILDKLREYCQFCSGAMKCKKNEIRVVSRKIRNMKSKIVVKIAEFKALRPYRNGLNEIRNEANEIKKKILKKLQSFSSFLNTDEEMNIKLLQKFREFESKFEDTFHRIAFREESDAAKKLKKIERMMRNVKACENEVRGFMKRSKKCEKLFDENVKILEAIRMKKDERRELEKEIDTMTEESFENDFEEFNDECAPQDQNRESVSSQRLKKMKAKLEVFKDEISEKYLVLQSNRKKIEDWFSKKQLLSCMMVWIQERKSSQTNPLIKLLTSRGVFVRNRTLDNYVDLVHIQQNRGDVYKGRLRGDPTMEMKCLKVVSLTNISYQTIKDEIGRLLELDHPSIIQIEKVFMYQDSSIKKIGIQMKYIGNNLLVWLKGEENIQRVKSKGEINDDEYKEIISLKNIRDLTSIRVVFRKILLGLAYLHSKQIEHRDLKHENVVVGLSHDIKIIDFEISKKSIMPTLTRLKNAGTARYKSDDDPISKKSDVFSVGRMLFECLARSEQVNTDPRHPGFVKFVTENMKYLKNDQRDLLLKMLEKNPTKRLTAQECLDHEFFSFDKDESVLKEKIDSPKVDSFYKMVDEVSLSHPDRIIRTRRMKMNREGVLKAFNALFSTIINPRSLLFDTHVRFYHHDKNGTKVEESGIDGGGLTREAYTLLVREMKEKKYVDAMNDKETHFLPSDRKDYKDFFLNFGKIYAKCILDKRSLGLEFGPVVFLEMFKKRAASYEELIELGRIYDSETVDTYVNQEQNLKDFSFVDESFNFLNPDTGKEELLCQINKRAFYRLKIHEMIYGTMYRLDNISAFVKGFFMCLKPDLIYYILTELNPLTMQKLGAGVSVITKQHLLQNIDFCDNEKINDWIKEWISNSDAKIRRKFISFVTGSDALPHDGVLLCRGVPRNIKIEESNQVFAHTCSFVLEIADSFQTYKQFEAYMKHHVLQKIHLHGQYDDFDINIGEELTAINEEIDRAVLNAINNLRLNAQRVDNLDVGDMVINDEIDDEDYLLELALLESEILNND